MGQCVTLMFNFFINCKHCLGFQSLKFFFFMVGHYYYYYYFSFYRLFILPIFLLLHHFIAAILHLSHLELNDVIAGKKEGIELARGTCVIRRRSLPLLSFDQHE